MKKIFAMMFLFSAHAFASTSTLRTCNQYQAYCACFPAVPMEGFKLHIVEVCDGREEWFTSYDAPTFGTQEECLSATVTDPVCQELQSASSAHKGSL